MAAQKRIILFVTICNCVFSSYFFGDAKILLTKFSNCDQNKNYKLKLNITFKIENGEEYADGTFSFAVPLDNHIRGNSTVEMLIANKYIYLFSIIERKGCEAWNKYLGEFWYEIQRNAQMIPELCPLAPGRYHVHHCLLNFDKISTVTNFPFGNLRFTNMLYDNKNNLFSCFLIEAQNKL